MILEHEHLRYLMMNHSINFKKTKPCCSFNHRCCILSCLICAVPGRCIFNIHKLCVLYSLNHGNSWLFGLVDDIWHKHSCWLIVISPPTCVILWHDRCFYCSIVILCPYANSHFIGYEMAMLQLWWNKPIILLLYWNRWVSLKHSPSDKQLKVK